MADYSDNDLRYYADRLDAVLHQFTGMGAGTTSSTGSGTFGRNKTAFHKSMDKATEGLEFMHGSAMDASHALRNFLGMSAISGIVTAVVHSMTDMYSTFSKLTDVGFNFGGSMLEMQKQAADSGLSLDEFARSLGKNSVVVAQMGTQGVKQFADFQSAVRGGLKQFGYYGMTLSQVDDASGEYLDDLRLTGQLTHLTGKEQAGAAKEFITDVNAMAAATGKSREEIIKLTTQALNSEPAAAARLSGMGSQVTTAFMKTVATLASSMGDAGPELSKMFAQTFAANGQTWATDLGDTLIKTGLGSVNSMFAQMNDEVASGHADNAEIAEQTVAIKEEIGSHLEQLRALRLSPGMGPSVDRVLKLYNELPANAQLIAKKLNAADQARLDGVTQAAALFETGLHEMTAKFRYGLYKGMLDMIAPGKKGPEQAEAFAKTIEKVKDTLQDLGMAFGKAFGLLIDAITPVTWAFEILVAGFSKVQTAIEAMLKPFGLGAVGGGELQWEKEPDKNGQRVPIYEKDDDDNVKLDSSGKPIQARSEATNYAKILGSSVTIGLAGLTALWIKRRISGKMHMAARDVYIAAKGVFGPNGQPMFGGGEGYGGRGGGGVGAGEAEGGVKGAPKGRMARMGARLRGGGGTVFRGVLGFAAGELLNGMISLLPDFAGKDQIEEIVPWASTALNIFAPQFVSGIFRRFGSMFSGVFGGMFRGRGPEQLELDLGEVKRGGLLSRAGGFIKTGFKAFMSNFNNIPIPRMSFGPGLLGRLTGSITGGFRAFMSNFNNIPIPRMSFGGLFSRFTGMFKGIGNIFPRMFRGIGTSMTGMFRSGGGLLKGIGSVFTRMFSGIGASIAGMFRGGGGLLKMAGGLLRGGGILKLVGRGLIGGLVSLLIDPFLNLFGNFTGKATLSSMATYAGIGASIGSLFAGVGAIPGAIVGGIIGIIIENFNSLIGGIGALLKESWIGASAWVKSFFDGIIGWFHDQLFGEDPAKKIKDAKKEVAGGKSWWRYILGLDDAKTPATEAAGKAAAGAMGPNPIDGKAMEGMYAQLPGMLAAGMRIDPLGGGPDGADRYNAFAKAIVDVQNDTARNFLTPPVPTDNFETLNQRLLDTMALISIDQEKNAKAPDPKLDIEIQKAQLEQLQLQNALISRGNSLQQDANRVSPWQ